MDESYVELLVPCKKNAAVPWIRNGLIVLAVISFGLVFLTGNVFIFFIFVALLVGAYTEQLHVSTEYEYLYLDKEFTVDRILNQSKRKRAAVYDLEKLEVMAPEGSHHLDAYKGRNEIKTYDYTSRLPDSQPYEMMIKADKGLYRVRIEVNDKLLAQMSKRLPRKIYKE